MKHLLQIWFKFCNNLKKYQDLNKMYIIKSFAISVWSLQRL